MPGLDKVMRRMLPRSDDHRTLTIPAGHGSEYPSMRPTYGSSPPLLLTNGRSPRVVKAMPSGLASL